ncbi:MAG: LON peptidase substrate-binding domain-containing protein [Gammaproteobacteria bacterium]|nr:LON peptidase substrate-binding domain-containing protein [Gammaproteobacteria bacterium]
MSSLLELPLFPLQNVLFPENFMPLRIFEPRYLSLIRDCQQNETGFGVVAIKTGDEVKSESGQSTVEIHGVGTLASVTKVNQVAPDLLSIWIRGSAKFEVEAHWQAEDGIETGLVEFLPSEPVYPFDLKGEEQILNAYFQISGTTDEEKEKVIEKLSTNTVANRLAHYIPFPLQVKQQLLELNDPNERLELIKSVLK